MAFDPKKIASAMNARQKRDPKYPPSMLVRVTGVDVEANTLNGTIIGGLHDGEELKGVTFTGKATPKRLLKKGAVGSVEQSVIDEGRLLISIDGYNAEKNEARWFNSAGMDSTPLVSTRENPVYLRVFKTDKMWPATEDDPEAPRYDVMSARVGEAAVVTDVEAYKAKFLELASEKGGRGAFNIAIVSEAGDRYVARQNVRFENGQPTQTPQERLDAVMAQIGGEEELAGILADAKVIFVPTEYIGPLSRFQTVKMLAESANGNTVMDRFTIRGHAGRIEAALSSKSDAEIEKVKGAWTAWQGSNGLTVGEMSEAPNSIVEKFAADCGVTLPKLRDDADFGWLPASATTVTMPPKDGREAQTLVRKILQSAQNPLPFWAVPLRGDEKATDRYYDIHTKLVDAIVGGPAPAGVDPVKEKAAVAMETPAAAEVDAASQDSELDDLLDQMSADGDMDPASV